MLRHFTTFGQENAQFAMQLAKYPRVLYVKPYIKVYTFYSFRDMALSAKLAIFTNLCIIKNLIMHI